MQHIQSMQKREAFVQKQVGAELVRAKECSKKKDKRGALVALKKKKLYEQVCAQRHAYPCSLPRMFTSAGADSRLATHCAFATICRSNRSFPTRSSRWSSR